MAFDDPVVWILIIAVIVFMFGSSKIPQFARALGQAKKEFDNGWKGMTSDITNSTFPAASTQKLEYTNSGSSQVRSSGTSYTDPIVLAAQREGIDTQGKTREQLADELSWKLNKK